MLDRRSLGSWIAGACRYPITFSFKKKIKCNSRGCFNQDSGILPWVSGTMQLSVPPSHCDGIVVSLATWVVTSKMREKGVRKNPGCSLMEAEDGIIHELFASDITHPKSKEIKEALEDLLQTSFGLLTTTAGIPIRNVKNLRVCEDFHTVMCGASLIIRREIVEG
ncbi:hypothetical protein IFM89_039870 [Coptis chinensis]|uniref:DYW domain-containing protein n=1 Tax=Coptis chinensis TaxID=261450 RepID=A0A835LA94_9MAGN|nr:hypothetical protein IFM89_039870 [Coptis chinensis]